MNKEELIKATQILQKHIPNRFPLKNSYIDAMEEYALWYHEEQSKLSQHDVIKNEVAVCPECGCNKVQKLAGDNYSCMNAYCEWQTVL